jgi:hypothetical protein
LLVSQTKLILSLWSWFSLYIPEIRLLSNAAFFPAAFIPASSPETLTLRVRKNKMEQPFKLAASLSGHDDDVGPEPY